MNKELGSYAKPPLFVLESLKVGDVEMKNLKAGFTINPVRGFLANRMLEMIEENRTKLETASTDETPKIQGELNGLKRAYALLVNL